MVQCSRDERAVELHIIAGQSNAQGYQGDATHYPAEESWRDKNILFFYHSTGNGKEAGACSSDGKWVSMRPQSGRFEKGYFGPEVSFARALDRKGVRPAIFKYTKPSSSLAESWKGPSDQGDYTAMCRDLSVAIEQLRKEHPQFKFASFTWIQGESDAETDEMASGYEERLRAIVRHIRKTLQEPELPIILGADEEHPWVKERPAIIEAQKRIAEENQQMAFLSMRKLEKFDTSHLTPSGLVEHGKRLFEQYEALITDLEFNLAHKSARN